MPRIPALLMLRSTMNTVSAPASRSFRGSLPHPTHQLCTLRVRHRCRLTQHSPPGGLLGLTWAGLAPADRASFAWRLRRGRDASCLAPPAQIRTCGFPAYGSHLGCVTAKQTDYCPAIAPITMLSSAGHGSRAAAPDSGVATRLLRGIPADRRSLAR